jgi:O-antigen/teichoic acid export membrane protein
MSLTRRVAHAVAASAFGQAVTIGAQVLLTPLFFVRWGAEGYGEWLLLSGIPAYLAIADAGIGSAAGNDMTIRAGAGDREGAQKTFRGAMLVAAGAGLVALVMGLCAAAALGTTNLFHLTTYGGWYGARVVIALSVYVGLNFANGVVYSGYKCCGRNAMGIALTNIGRLAESLIIALMLALHTAPLAVAIAMVTVKILSLAFQFVGLRNVCPWLFTPYAAPDTRLIVRLITPALAFLAFPMSNAFLLQGPLLIIGSTLGGTAIAVYSAFRTLARIPLQMTNVLNSSVWPEVSLAYGASDTVTLRRIHTTTVAAAVYGALLSSSLIWIFGPFIVTHWLHGKVNYDGLLLFGLLLATVISSIWNASSIVLSATNQHARYGATFLLVSTISILLCYPAAIMFGLYGIAAIMVLSEISMALFVVRQSLVICVDTGHELMPRLLNAPMIVREAVGRILRRRRNNHA